TCGSSHPILKKDLEKFPYKLQVYHKVLPRDFVPRIAISRRRIIFMFFDQNINSIYYVNNTLTPFIWQQDNATAHTANEIMPFLRQFYDDLLISRNLAS
ncbi:hypothetical protein BDFB_008863, partial [Asbolus verrucosus]